MIDLMLAAAISWPVQYNTGVAAYHSNDFSSAAAVFEQATAAPDHALQERAYYNLGNTSYRLGEADPAKAQPLWERAVKNYDSALAINPNDEDAKFNREFVKKKIEELKKKQQQQQNQDNKNQDQKKQDQKKKEQPEPNQQQSQQDERKKDDQQSKSEPKQPSEEKPQPAQTGNLDKQQAKALLDNVREAERNWNFFPEAQMQDLKDESGPVKDW